MKIIRFIMVCAAASLVTLTAGFAQHVQTDFEHQANFAQYKTYSWQEIKPGASLWDSRIKNAVNAQLEAKGLTQAADDGDIAIVAIKTSQTQRTLQTFTTTSAAEAGDGAALAALGSQPLLNRTTRKVRW